MATANGMAREAMGYLDGHINDWKQVLVDLCRIPSMSASGFPAEQVRRSAQAVAKALTDAGVGLYQKVAKPSAKQLARIRSLKFSEAKFKKDSGMLPGMALWGERKFSPLE